MNTFYFIRATHIEPEYGYALSLKSWMDKTLSNLLWSLSWPCSEQEVGLEISWGLLQTAWFYRQWLLLGEQSITYGETATGGSLPIYWVRFWGGNFIMHHWKLIQIDCLKTECLPRQFKKLTNSNKLSYITVKALLSKRLSKTDITLWHWVWCSPVSTQCKEHRTFQLVVYKNGKIMGFSDFFPLKFCIFILFNFHPSFVSSSSSRSVWEWRSHHQGILRPKSAASVGSHGYLITTRNKSLRGHK